MTGALRPRRLEREQNAAVAQELKPVLADRRTQEIAAQLLEPRAVPGGHRDIRVEVEAVELRVPRTLETTHAASGSSGVSGPASLTMGGGRA